ncbi:MAG: YihY/virulence factor BrkB family protein [Gaiellaceae bacterium]
MHEWREAVVGAAKRFLADDCMGLAKEIAYSALLAFFPAVAFVLGLLGLLHLYDQVQILLATIAPRGVIRFIQTLQNDSGGGASVAAFVVGLAGTTWAASGAMGTVVKAVNRAYELPETRPFWKVRLISILLVVLSGITTAAVLLLVIFGGPLGDAVAKKAHIGGAWTVIWAIVRWPVAFAAILLFFAFIYNLAPNRPQRRWRWFTPGSLLGAVLWLVLSALFTLYTTFAGSYSKTYGTLAAGVILLLWLNYTAWAILFGAELNAELERAAG